MPGPSSPAAPLHPESPPRDPHAATGAPRLAFRPDVEGLRGVAVLLVVAFHAGVPGFSGGFVGVDVFFVLSGYLITALLVAEVDRTGRVDLARFYARRARRLLPASALALLAVIVAGALVYSPLEALRPARAAVATAVYASNVLFAISLNYFAPAAETNPLLHTWSLAVEEQFYLVWPVLILLAARRSRGRVAVVLAAVSAVSLAACAWLTGREPAIGFYATPLRAWEFGVGGLACLLPAGALATLRSRGAGVLAGAGAAAVLAAAVLFSWRTPFPGTAALLPVLGTAALLAACAASPATAVARALGTPGLQFIGRLSYSWYLWHWPSLVFAAALVPAISLRGRMGVVLLSLLIAWGTYTGVERPIRESRSLAARSRPTLVGAGALTLLMLACALGWHAVTRRQMLSPAQAPYVAATRDLWAPLQAGRCMVMDIRDARVRECAVGDTTSASTIVLLGDSHAAQWAAALDRAAADRGLRLVTMLKSGCPAPRVPTFNPLLRAEAPECAAWRQAALRRIAVMRPSAVVVASWHGYVRDGGDRSSPYAQLTPAEWGAGMRETLRALTAEGMPVLLVRDPPSPGIDVPACLSRGGACTFPREPALHEAAFRAESAAARGLPVAILDLTDRFCDASRCAARVDGTIVYLDNNHVTASYSARLAPAFADALERLVRPSAPAPR